MAAGVLVLAILLASGLHGFARAEPAKAPPPEAIKARERAKQPGVVRSERPRRGRVYEIRVVGARKVEPDAVLVNIQTRTDSRPDQRVIQGDVRRIFQMGFFSDVVVESLPGPKGSLILVYRLVEKPAIANVVIEGNREVSKDDIEEVIDLKAYQVLDVQKVRQNVEKIRRLYVDKGFFLAEVTWEVRPSEGVRAKEKEDLASFFQSLAAPEPEAEAESPPPPTPEKVERGDYVDVVFRIQEAAKVRVEQVVFVGNRKVSSDTLKQVMRTRENHPLGMFLEWGTYKEELLEVDLMAIEAVYQDLGYINVQVGRPRVELSADKTRLSLFVPITEGEQYSLKSFDVGGDLIVEDDAQVAAARAEDPERVVFSREKLLARTRVRPGDIFSRSAVATDVMAIADLYRDRGYAYVNIVPETRVYEEERSVDLVLQVSAGPRVTIERIEITGNTKTQDRVIRRELRLYEGEYYSATALRLSQQRVQALGYFETVDVTTRQGSGADRMVVVFDVKEKPTGTFQLGAGFSNAEQFIFTGQIAQNNFLGRGFTVSGSLQWSAYRQMVDFRFIDPYFLYIGQEPVTFAFTAYNTQANYIDFVRNSTGGDLTLGYPVGRPLGFLSRAWLEDAPEALRPYVPDFENFQLFTTLSAERVEIPGQSFDVILRGLSANAPRYTTSVAASLIFDQRNNRIFPSKGYYLQLRGEVATPYLGSGLLPGAERSAKELTGGVDFLEPNLGFLKSTARPTEFSRFGFTARAYYSFDDVLPLSGVVLKGNVEVGVLLSDDPTLIFERYFLGGFNTIRGYPLRSIAPVARVGGLDPSAPLEEFRVGGTKQFFTNLELEFPIFEQVGIRGVLFFDAGNAYGPDENFFYIGQASTPFLENFDCGADKCFDPRRDLSFLGIRHGLFTAVGFGVRWFSPIGPLRFEWGVPLNPRPAGTFGVRRPDQPLQFEFNIGQSF